MSVTCEEWAGPDIVKCADNLSDDPYMIFLDSSRLAHPDSEYSYLCWNPTHIIKTKNKHITIDGITVNSDDFYDILKKHLRKNEQSDHPVPFYGGIIGYFSYDFGAIQQNIKIQKDDLHLPDAMFGIYKNVLCKNHKTNEQFIFFDNEEEKKLLQNSLETDNSVYNTPQWQNSLSQDNYYDLINQTKEQITKGEFYQVNISRRLKSPRPNNYKPFQHYKKLRQSNSAPFSIYANFNDFNLLSCSPERFLKVTNKNVTTKPIKGTLRSTEDSNNLKSDTKERAENTMIVDLLRNDISKTCQPNSVEVDKLCEIETFENLHHLVSTISGRLEDDKDIFDLLKDALPGGSITGAPKIAAMNYIAKKELCRRGLYCGSFGYIGYNGNADFNILIRTLIATEDHLILNAGGGIVSDSDPIKEYDETTHKIEKILKSFEQ